MYKDREYYLYTIPSKLAFRDIEEMLNDFYINGYKAIYFDFNSEPRIIVLKKIKKKECQ